MGALVAFLVGVHVGSMITVIVALIGVKKDD